MKQDQTRTLQILMFLVGVAWAIYGLLTGRLLDPGVYIALVVEVILLYLSISRRQLTKDQLLIFLLLTLIYIPLSIVGGFFSEMVIMAFSGVIIYFVFTERQRLRKLRPDADSTSMILAGIYGAGMYYCIFVMSLGDWIYPGVILTLIIEGFLLYSAIFRSPPDKTELSIISIMAILVLIVGSLPVLHHVVIMAVAGLLIYGTVRAEPKFPLTKRALSTGILVGIIMTFLGIWLALKLGVVFLVGAEMLGAIILSLKGRYSPEENTIVVAIANSSAMVSIGVLITFPAIAIFEPQNPLFDINHVYTDLFNPITTLSFIILVTGLSAFFGILLLAPFRDRFENEPWPQVQPQAYTIKSIGGDAEAKKAVGTGLGIATAWVGTTRVAESLSGASLSSFPNAVTPVIPSWVGISNSPMMVGIGFFVGWKRSLVMALGSVISLLIWIILEGASPLILYETHIKRAEILYIALGIFATVLAGDFLSQKNDESKDDLTPEEFEKETTTDVKEIDGAVIVENPIKSSELLSKMRVKEELFSIEMFREEVREIIADPRGYLKSRRGQLPPWIAFISLIMFMIVGIIVFSVIVPFPGVQIPVLLFLIGTPIAMVSVYFTARAISETGMLAGYITDIIAIPAIILFRVSFAVITTFMSMLGALQDAAIALLVHLKLGRLTNVRGRDILKAVTVGALLGTTIGSFITFTLFETYGGFGGTDLPSPAAQLFGFLIISLNGLGGVDGGGIRLPGMDQFPGLHPILSFIYLFSFAIIGFLLGRELNKRGLSPMSLVIGVLIPPATAVAIILGGYINYRVKKDVDPEEPLTDEDQLQQQAEFQDANYGKTSRILSGIVAGEAVITVIIVLGVALSAILFGA
ncbi:MAG: OPT/YSL family transporter [Candidatus Thorarchaeota archaeon]